MKHSFIKVIAILVGIITMSLCLCSCGSSTDALKIGDEVYLDNCLSASTEDNFKELDRICNRKDESALVQGMCLGAFKELEKYTSRPLRKRRCLILFLIETFARQLGGIFFIFLC